ncbi:MAG: VgrG-related protein [Actinomycetota bacterium]|nr:VgrG-related protein [Actinomycetota bacterium]
MPALTLAPSISLGGSLLSQSWQDALLECKVDLEMRAPGQARLRFADPGYSLSKSGTIGLGSPLAVAVPQAGRLISAEVTAVGVEQRQGENPELVVTALDRSHRMGRGSRVKTYLNASYSDIASQLAGEYDLSPSVEGSGGVLEYVLQVSSDLTFLSDMAARAGFDWWVDGTTLYFKKPAAGDTVELRLGETLWSFSVQASGSTPGSVEVNGWDRDKQEQLSASANSRTLSPSSDFAGKVTDPDKAFGTAKLITGALAGQTQDEVDALSQALFDWAASTSVRATGLAQVSAGLKLGCSVRVLDTGPLAGTYPITRVEHTYRPGRGFLTKFWSGGRGFAPGDGASRYPPLQGPTTHHPGLVVGEVTSINDPNQTGRVKVRFPGLDATQESAWGRVLSPGAGDNRGSVVLPEVGDEVLVGFEQGDPRQPVILGGLYGSRLKIPKWPVKEGKVASRQFISRAGHVVEVSDGDDAAEQYFMVQLAGQEHTLKMTKQETTLAIPSGQALTVKAGGTQVAFSTTGDITLKGQNITIEAEQNLKLKGLQVDVSATTQLQLQGQAQASMKGAMLQLESEGPASLKGAIVQIN